MKASGFSEASVAASMMVAALAVAAVATPGCKGGDGGGGSGRSGGGAVATGGGAGSNGEACSAGEACAGSGAGKVAKVAFVDLKDACECTAKRTEGSWTALEWALAGSPGITVERIHMDEDEAGADKYGKMRDMMVVPGIYFLDQEGKLVEMLQGEVAQEQIAKVLSGG